MADIDFKNGVNVDSAYMDGHKVRLIAIPDGSLELPISATSDSGYVVDANGKKHRVLLATFLNGTPDYKLSPTADSAYMTVDGQKVKVRLVAKLTNSLELPSSANADQGYALGDDSKKHRVTLVATPTGTLELPNSETDDSAYVVDGNGKKYKVRLFFLAYGGAKEVIVKGVAPLSLPDAIANSLSYVKAFGGTEQRNLPDNYIERQFIYMMDGSYIQVEDLPISAGYKVEFDFQTTSLSSPLRNYLGGRVGGVAAGGGFRLSKLASGGTTLNRVVLYGFEAGTEYYDPTAQFQANTRYKYTYNNGVCTLESGGSVVSTNTFTVTDNTSTDWVINGYINGTYLQSASDGIYVYSLKVWNTQGELVMDLVPAVQRGTVPVVGFYDTVTGGFRTATDGTFAAGGEAVPTPDAPMDIVSNNGVLKYSANIANVNAQTALVGYYISASGVVTADSYNWIYQDYIPVSPNTTYTLTMSQSVYYVSISEYSTASDSGFVIRKTGSTGTNTRLTITTGATTNFVRFGANLDRTTVTLAKVLAINWQLNKGNSMPYTPYVEGGVYTDGTVETINVHGKNLFNKNTALLGDIATNGAYVSRTYRVVSDYIPVSFGQTFVGSGTLRDTDGVNYTANVIKAFYKADKSYIAGSRASVTSGTFTIDNSECAYMRIVFFNQSLVAGKTVSLENSAIQVELGSTATEYQPYFDGGTATAEMLLKVGDYQDVQSILDGVVTRNVGVKVLDGTEHFATFSGLSGTFSLLFVDMATGGANLKQFVCTHLVPSNLSEPPYGTLKAGGTITAANIIVYFRPAESITTVGAFKQWLADQYAAGTPVIIVYPLKTPTTESVAGQTLQVTDGDNTLEITQASLTGLELEAQYQAAVSLTIQEVQDANLDNNVQVTIQ